MGLDNIQIKGCRVNNLKNLSLEIPRNQFIVITGLSGSGKSSLAFDTLFAEGQRRYVESLSSYARQFLGRINKPECDFIKGLPPAIAIEQKVNNRNARSTVGTSTEIYDFLRLLYSRIGQTFSPISGDLVKKNTSQDVINTINSYPKGTRFALLSPICMPADRDFATQLRILLKCGYSRLMKADKFINISDIVDNGNDYIAQEHYLLIDRMAVTGEKDDEMRLLDSLQTAFSEGNDQCVVKFWLDGGGMRTQHFSKRFEADGMTFQEPTDLMFNFNNPIGACPECEGFGRVMGIDENLVIPNKTLSIANDAVLCWRGEVMSKWKFAFLHRAAQIGFPVHEPYYNLTQEQKDLLWHGDEQFGGIDAFFRYIQSKSSSIQYRVLYARYRGKSTCPVCHGSRLKKEASYVKIAGRTITELVKLPIEELKTWFETIELSETDKQIAKRLLTEINSRLSFLVDVGLGYLTLDRLSSSLSGGESQRINLATSLGSTLVGSIYILDEPSIGLHSRDTQRLLNVMKRLKSLGNTVVVVEHDEEIIRAADMLIDIGPEAGRAGGYIVFQGPAENAPKDTDSYTIKYLRGDLTIATPQLRRPWQNAIVVEGAAENNLKNITVRFPLGIITAVTGVSGSGKSTLVKTILHRALERKYAESSEAPGTHVAISGDLNMINNVVLIDQNPIGKSSRSNPATYLKAFDEIRHLFSEQQLSKQMGYGPGYFSFNSPGGRCEECKGDGHITIEMQFMADITLTCECCHGKRYSQTALEVEYGGKNLADILEMTVNQAIEFFSAKDGNLERRIVKRLKPLQDVGLGYIKLGQPSSTLSGGENQRVKLAYHLSEDRSTPTMFILDEPTTGLHFHDINTLMRSFNRLVEHGHTVIIIEHNMDVIKCADHVIDLGPEGGDKGGTIVFEGTPEQLALCPNSYTGQHLKQYL